MVCGNDLYGGTPRLFNQVMTDFGLEFSYIDTAETENVERAIRRNTRMVYVETPTNPMMRLSDLAALPKRVSFDRIRSSAPCRLSTRYRRQ